MTELRVPLEGALQLALVLNAGGVIGSLSTGFVATRLGSLRTLGCAGLICAAMLILIPSGLVSGAGLMVLVTVLGMVAPTTQNLVNALVAEIVPAQSRAASLGRTLGVGRLGAITAPLIGSWLLAHIPRGSGLQGGSRLGLRHLCRCVSSRGGHLLVVPMGCAPRPCPGDHERNRMMMWSARPLSSRCHSRPSSPLVEPDDARQRAVRVETPGARCWNSS